MGVNKMPDYKLYWSKNAFLHNEGFSKTMTVKRYEKLTQYLHCNAESNGGNDPLVKIRDVMDSVSENLTESYHPRKNQTVDEGMIAYKGRHKVHKFSHVDVNTKYCYMGYMCILSSSF